MFKDAAINWAKERFAKERHHMMRLWAASWRISPVITIAAAALISAPIAVATFFAGKAIGTTNIGGPVINNIMPGSGAASDQTEKTKIAVGPRKREAAIPAAAVPTSLRILFGPSGVPPKELNSQNIEWQAIEQAYEGYQPKYSISSMTGSLLGGQATACITNSVQVDERCWEKYSYKTLKLVLSFPKPITFRKLAVEVVQGGKGTSWEQVIMTETDAVLEFRYYPEDKLIEIKATDEKTDNNQK